MKENDLAGGTVDENLLSLWAGGDVDKRRHAKLPQISPVFHQVFLEFSNPRPPTNCRYRKTTSWFSFRCFTIRPRNLFFSTPSTSKKKKFLKSTRSNSLTKLATSTSIERSLFL
jgi:hypothetical protein